MKKIFLTTSLAVTLVVGVSESAHAVLASNAVLNFNLGVTTTDSSGNFLVISGSYFGMDTTSITDGFGTSDGVFGPNEKIPISQNNGLVIGVVQTASGSHGGFPDGSESPAIDTPWDFAGNTGMHLTTSPVTVLGDDGAGNVTLDFSGWAVTWNGISVIDMGGGIQDCGTASDGLCKTGNGTDISGVFDNGTGIATVTCAADCAVGDSFTLDYLAVVPQTIPFGGIGYALHLEGTISSVPVPAALWLLGSGLLGLASVARCRKA